MRNAPAHSTNQAAIQYSLKLRRPCGVLGLTVVIVVAATTAVVVVVAIFGFRRCGVRVTTLQDRAWRAPSPGPPLRMPRATIR